MNQIYPMGSLLQWVPFVGSYFKKPEQVKLSELTPQQQISCKFRDRAEYALYLESIILSKETKRHENKLNPLTEFEVKQQLQDIPSLHLEHLIHIWRFIPVYK